MVVVHDLYIEVDNRHVRFYPSALMVQMMTGTFSTIHCDLDQRGNDIAIQAASIHFPLNFCHPLLELLADHVIRITAILEWEYERALLVAGNRQTTPNMLTPGHGSLEPFHPLQSP